MYAKRLAQKSTKSSLLSGIMSIMRGNRFPPINPAGMVMMARQICAGIDRLRIYNVVNVFGGRIEASTSDSSVMPKRLTSI
jgi:hypothetical protein